MSDKETHEHSWTRVSRRRFLKGAGGLVGTALTPAMAHAGARVAEKPAEHLGPDGAALTLVVNDREYRLSVPANATLLDVLRGPELGLSSARQGCGQGECGACTVLLDGKPVYACMMLALDAEGKRVTTAEGLVKDGKLHPVQEAFVAEGAAACGFCAPGLVLSTKALLDRAPAASDAEARRALAGHHCRCGSTTRVLEAVRVASKRPKGAS